MKLTWGAASGLFLSFVAAFAAGSAEVQPASAAELAASAPGAFRPVQPISLAAVDSEDEPVPEIDATVRQRIEADSKQVESIAENLVGVQGDINRVEKEVLGKVFDMATMKTFLDKHETAIKEHEKLEQHETDLTDQANLLTKQLDKAYNDSRIQDETHRHNMAELGSKVAEDKAVIQGLEQELIPLVEMQKEVSKFPEINANMSAKNTKTVSAAQAVTQELLYERSKLQNYKETTANLMKELVKQHTYATKCHDRLTSVNLQIHEVETKRAREKYERAKADEKGAAMEKFLTEANGKFEKRLKKAKTNNQTVAVTMNEQAAKIKLMQITGQHKLEELRAELGKLRQQSSSIEVAMMAKITNRKLIEKALKGAQVQVEDLQSRLVAGRLGKLRSNNTQMTNELAELRKGLQASQVTTAQAEAQRSQLESIGVQYKWSAGNSSIEAQEVAREALAKVAATKQSTEEFAQKAQEEVMSAEASMLTKCSVIWQREHPKVLKKLEKCQQTKLDLDSTKASVASLTSSISSAGSTQKAASF